MPPIPGRIERYSTGPRDPILIAIAIAISSGLSTISQKRGDDEVEGALEREVDPLEDRRAQLEQRHRLPGDELGSVDEDLRRRRRDPHAHPAAMRAIDQLEQLALGEVGVDDDHLVDTVALDRLADLGQRAERAQSVIRMRGARDEPDDLDRRMRA